MKHTIILFLFFFSFISLAQQKGVTSKKPAIAQKVLVTILIPKGRLIEAKGIRDLIIIPKTCKVSGFSISCKQFDILYDIPCKGETFPKEVLMLFNKGHEKQLYVFDRIKSSCGKAVKKRYEITIKP